MKVSVLFFDHFDNQYTHIQESMPQSNILGTEINSKIKKFV